MDLLYMVEILVQNYMFPRNRVHLKNNSCSDHRNNETPAAWY